MHESISNLEISISSMRILDIEEHRESIKNLFIDEWKDEFPPGYDFDKMMDQIEFGVDDKYIDCYAAYNNEGTLIGFLMSHSVEPLAKPSYQEICKNAHLYTDEVLFVSTILIHKNYREQGIASKLYPKLRTDGYKALLIRTIGEKQINLYTSPEDTDGPLKNVTGYTQLPTPKSEPNPKVLFAIKIIKNPEMINDEVQDVIKE